MKLVVSGGDNQQLYQGPVSMLLAGVQGHLEGSHNETYCVRW